MKVMLIFPPQFEPIQPYLSLPSLTAYLQSKGVPVVQRDLNVEIYDMLMTREYLQKAYERVCHSFDELESKAKLHVDEQKRYDALFGAKASAPRLIERVDEAKRTLRNKRDFYDFAEYCEAKENICYALELISAAYYPTKLGFSLFNMQGSRESSKGVIAATRDKERNPFIEIYEDSFLEQVHSEGPDIIGISIVNSEQTIPGLTLAYLLKLSGCKAHITVGGGVFSRLADILPQRRELFSLLFDSIVVYEGERPLLELVESISDGRSFERVPNLIYYDGTEVRVNDICSPESVNSLPTPCFDGFPLDLYFSPQTILPLLSSRGCYWHKCAFCDHGYIYNNRYEPRESKKVADDLQSLSDKYNASYFQFSDEGIAPGSFRSLSEEIIKRELNVKCMSDARFEPEFTPELCKKMNEAGFRCLYFGLESGCDRVLNHMKKGTNKQTVINVCRNSAQAGIWNHLYLFFGFPTETDEEAQETMELIFNNKEFIHSIGSGTFVLGKHSPVCMHPEYYGVSEVLVDPDRDLRIWHNYNVDSGLTKQDAKKIHDDFLKRLCEEYSDIELWTTLHREHLLLYAVHYGTNDLSSLLCAEECAIKEVVPPTEDVDWLALLPTLKDSVVYDTLSFDVVTIQENVKEKTYSELSRQQTHVVYNSDNAKLVSINASGRDILDICDGETNVHQIASEISKSYSVSISDAEIGCIAFLRDMVNRGLLLV